MIVKVTSGPSRAQNVRIINTGESFSITTPSYDVEIAFFDGSSTVWKRDHKGRPSGFGVPGFINDPNPRQYLQNRASESACGVAIRHIRDATPFPISEFELQEQEKARQLARLRELARQKSARTGLAKMVPWAVTPDVWPEPIITGNPIRLDVRSSDVLSVQYSPLGGGRVLILHGRASRPIGYEQTAKQVDIYDITSGAKLQSIRRDEGLIVGGLLDEGQSIVVGTGATSTNSASTGSTIAVHSVETGERVREWPANEFEKITWVAVAGDLILTRTDVHELTARHAKTGERVYAIENIDRCWLSPTAKYLVVFEKHGALAQGHFYETDTGMVVGNLPAGNASKINSPNYCAFSPDGGRLVMGRGYGETYCWDLTTGQIVHKFERLSAREPFGFVSPQLILSQQEFYTLGEPRAVWRFFGARVCEIDPTGRIWLTVDAGTGANAVLTSMEVPENDIFTYLAANRTSRGSISPGSTRFTYEALMRDAGVMGTLAPGGGTTPGLSAIPSDLFQAYVASVLADDQKISSQLKWVPGAKRPTIGERWGICALVRAGGKTRPVESIRDFHNMTGEIGSKFLKSMNERAVRGDFGDWASHNASALGNVAMTSGDDEAAIVENALAQQLNNLAIFEVIQSLDRRGRVQDARMKIVFRDLQKRREDWMSRSIRSSQMISEKRAGKDPAASFVESVMAVVDEHYAVTAMPDINKDLATQRSDQLSSVSPSTLQDKVHQLAEIRYYDANDLIGSDAATSYYKNTLSSPAGEQFPDANLANRQKLLRQWYSAQ